MFILNFNVRKKIKQKDITTKLNTKQKRSIAYNGYGLAKFAKRWLVRSSKLRQTRVMLSFFSLFFVRWVYFFLLNIKQLETK